MMRFRSVASPVKPRLVGLVGEVLEVSIAALDFGLCGGSHVSEFSFA